jgi:ABC-2 type transport system permease protein
MPKFLQLLTYLIPATYFIDVLSGIYLKNLGFDYLWPSMLVLALIFILLTVVNYVLLKKEGL